MEDQNINNSYYPKETSPSKYTHEEIENFYALGRLYLESGLTKRAEVVFYGILAISPNFIPAMLGLSYIYLISADYELSLKFSKDAIANLSTPGIQDEDIHKTEILTFLALTATALSLEDKQTAGTALGEIGDRISQGVELSSDAQRLFELLMARYKHV